MHLRFTGLTSAYVWSAVGFMSLEVRCFRKKNQHEPSVRYQQTSTMAILSLIKKRYRMWTASPYHSVFALLLSMRSNVFLHTEGGIEIKFGRPFTIRTQRADPPPPRYRVHVCVCVCVCEGGREGRGKGRMTNAIKNVFAYLVDAVTCRWRPDAMHNFFFVAIMGGSRFVSGFWSRLAFA